MKHNHYLKGMKVIILGVDEDMTTRKIVSVLKNADITFDKVFIEVERVCETLYDCIARRLVTAI